MGPRKILPALIIGILIGGGVVFLIAPRPDISSLEDKISQHNTQLEELQLDHENTIANIVQLQSELDEKEESLEELQRILTDLEKTLIVRGWELWEDGDIAEAEKIADAILDDASSNNEALHLKVAAAATAGKYREATELYSDIDPSYSRFNEVTDIVASIYAYHYKDLEKASQLYDSTGNLRAELTRERASRALITVSDGISIVPFLMDDPLSPFIPSISGKVNGMDAVLRMDTGGTYLHMGPEIAEAYGIELSEEHIEVKMGPSIVKGWPGIAYEMTIGDQVVLRNVPVMAMEGLPFVIFGTNVLEEFLCTIDYPNSRFILTPRYRDDLFEEHMNMVDGEKVKVSFYLWDDHYMFAKGRFGTNNDLNLFFDSGLVVLTETDGEIKQASFTASREALIRYGFDEIELNESRFFQTTYPLGTGGIIQDDTLVWYNENKLRDTTFGGVRIDGLISHGFLSKFSWTIDFDNHEYIFGVTS